MRFLTYVVAGLMVTGCGEVSYKRGASPQDYAQAERACNEQGSAAAECMQSKGWNKANLRVLDPLFATIEATDNRPMTGGVAVVDIPAKPALSDNTSKMPMKSQASASSVEMAHKPDIQAASPQAGSAQVEEKSAIRDTRLDGPDVEYAINSWWKRGAFPNQLQNDQSHCARELGANYLPDYRNRIYKRRFVVCMHELGWTAIREFK